MKHFKLLIWEIIKDKAIKTYLLRGISPILQNQIKRMAVNKTNTLTNTEIIYKIKYGRF